MNTREEAKELAGKLGLIQLEMNAKTLSINELRESNSKLLELQLGKKRKTPTLKLQRKQIIELTNEVAEMELTKKSLQGRFDNANSAIRKEQLKNRIKSFQENSKAQIMLVETVRRNVKALEKSLVELDGITDKSNSLYQILNLVWNDSSAKDLIDLRAYQLDWTGTRLELPHNLNERLEQFNNRIFGLLGQLEAMISGSRTIPSHRVPSKSGSITKVGTVQDIRNNMAAAEAMKNKKTQKHLGVKSTFKMKPRMMMPA